MNVTAYTLAERYIGTKEVAGKLHNDVIVAMLRLDDTWPEDDETAWCSAFANWIAWHLRLPRSRSLRARSWLGVGKAISLAEARIGWDVVILSRGTGPQPGPEVLDAPGHVGWFAGLEGDRVRVLGGNQGDSVNVSYYSKESVLGVRRLYEE